MVSRQRVEGEPKLGVPYVGEKVLAGRQGVLQEVVLGSCGVLKGLRVEDAAELVGKGAREAFAM